MHQLLKGWQSDNKAFVSVQPKCWPPTLPARTHTLTLTHTSPDDQTRPDMHYSNTPHWHTNTLHKRRHSSRALNPNRCRAWLCHVISLAIFDQLTGQQIAHLQVCKVTPALFKLNSVHCVLIVCDYQMLYWEMVRKNSLIMQSAVAELSINLDVIKNIFMTYLVQIHKLSFK